MAVPLNWYGAAFENSLDGIALHELVGARFEVYLPAVSEEPEGHPEIGHRGGEPTGTEALLVVEDEDAVREVTSRLLRMRGYTVVEAANPEEARKVFACQPVDLLVTDVVMPGGDGPALFFALSRLDPTLRVLYMSGYVDSAGIDDITALGAPLLCKPFAPDQLVRMVRDCLDA